MLPWLVGAVCLVSNVVAVLCFVAGRKAERPRRYAARSAIAAVMTLGTAVVAYVTGMAGAFAAVADADASRKATLLARAISEAMNLAAIAFAASLLPSAVAIWLLVAGARSSRAPAPR